MPWVEYKGYHIIYDEEDGKIVVKTANYRGIQCSRGQTFDSISDMKDYIDSGGWSVGSGTT